MTLCFTHLLGLLSGIGLTSIPRQLTNKDGRSYTFDDRGAGYGRGEGLGVLVLKRLDHALADGDYIHAVVVESGVGHDGKTTGILQPSSDAQEALARFVYAKAGLDPRETLFVESHGTGTVAGDAAEVGSIAKVFGREAGRTSELPIGSIKANIGHLEAASGMAGTIKAIMVLKKDQIPPQLNFINPKPSLRLEQRGLHIPLELTPLTPEGHTNPRRVSVNSFGYGGTNAHAILEAYDPEPLPIHGHVNGDGHHVKRHDNDQEAEANLIVLSANSELSLTRLISNMGQWLVSDQAQSVSFADLAYTLNTRRSKHAWRCSGIASNALELKEALENGKMHPVKSARDVALAFAFTGQGAQWFAMGRELLTSSKSCEFANAIELCNKSVKALGCEWDLAEELSRSEELSRLGEAQFAQPITTAVQIALVDLLTINYGIRPQAVWGHSSGEIAAAYAAGALTKEAAMRVAYMRGLCSSKAKPLNATPGAMLAVGEGEGSIMKRIKQLDGSNGKVTVACVNSPESTTVSGDVAAVLELQAVLEASSVFNRRLKVDSAYHSHHMEVVASSYLSSLDGLAHDTVREDLAFYSSVTGGRKRSGFGPSYWVSNLLSQVKFSVASQRVAQHLSDTHSTAANMLIEVGPHAALSGPLRQSLSESNFRLASGASFKYNYIPCLVRSTSALDTILALVGKVFESGSPVRLDGGKWTKNSSSQCQVVSNLPSYPWDHSNTYWRESRLSKASRLRPFPPHDLLGLFDVISSPYEPRWRYQVSLANIPWLRDHVIEGFVIFPGSGYLVMVIEAMKQLFQLRKTPGRIININIRDVTFAKPVVIHNDSVTGNQEVELQLIISPSRQYTSSPWQHFRVVSYASHDESWVDNCSGLVSWDSVVDEANTAQSEVDEFVGVRDDGLGHLTQAAAVRWLEDLQASCPISVDATETYRDLKASGNNYGDTFRGLKEIHVGKGCATARVVVQDITQHIPGHYMQAHTIHPSTLDSFTHLEPLCFRREGLAAPLIPTMLGDMSVAVDMDSSPGTDIVVALQHFQQTPRHATFSYCAFQKQSDGSFRPVVTCSGIRTQIIGEPGSDDAGQLKMTYRMEWNLDVDYITPADLVAHASRLRLCDDDGEAGDGPADAQLHLNDAVATIFIRRAVQRVREQGISTACTRHLSALLDWMVKWDATEAGRLLEGLTPRNEASLIEQSSRSNNIVGLALNRLGPHYLDILTGKAAASELLADDDMLGRLYSEHTLFNDHYAQISAYMQTLVHKFPRIKVLIVSGGAGGATLPLLETMERNSRLPMDACTYTDVSSTLLEHARSRLGGWAARMDFKVLDTSRDPLTQGFTAHSFDVIVGTMVQYAMPRVDVTIAHLRKLLKPAGRLVLMELTATSAAHNAVFGMLDGWWVSEDGRLDRLLMSVPEWDTCLKRHGFNGIDLAIPAHEGHSGHASTVIIARSLSVAAETANGQHQEVDERPLTAKVYFGYSTDASQVALGDAMSRSLGNKGIKCSRGAWSTRAAATQDQNLKGLAIVIDSAEHPLLLDPSPEIFEQVKELLLQVENILWVSFQASPPSADKAALKSMVSGMARVLRRENPGLQLITVNIQDPIQPHSRDHELRHVIQALTELTIRSFWAPEGLIASDALKLEHEYTIRGGRLTIPRVIPDDYVARHIDSRKNPGQNISGDAALVECKYLDKNRPLKVDIRVPGFLKTIRFVDNHDILSPVGPEEVEVQARAYGVNTKDVLIMLGQMAPGTPMMGEVAGIITAVGSNVQSWKVGDRVTTLSTSQFGSQVRIGSKNVVGIPNSVTFAEAASIPLDFFTAWHCFNNVARIDKGQKVLIHAGSDGVGQSAIQLAQLAGAEVFTTVDSVGKKKLIQERYGLPDSHIFSSHSGKFKKQILEVKQGNGVDIVLNSLSGQILRDTWDCLAPFGTFCQIGKEDILGRGQLSMANFDKQATFAAVDVSYMYRMRPEWVIRGITDIMAMVEQGVLKSAYPLTKFDMSRIEEAFSFIAERKYMGKLVLVADEQTLVQAARQKAPILQLQRKGTYVIGGGTGDLGKRIGRFLAEKGAGHIVSLTRRNVDVVAQQPAVINVKKAISNLGGTFHVIQCDIGDETSARGAAAKMTHLGLPPVRGVIQSATVLRDHPFEYMGLDDWKNSVRPKVQGTLNMHEAFCSPETTEFFVMLSSVASIVGSASQSNYAAGNAFLDAFAHARKQGPRGVTNYAAINVGAIEGSGLVAGALEQGSDVTRIVGSVSFDDVLATLEYTMNPQARVNQEVVQYIMHFNRDTMEDALGPSALSDPMYDHVPSERGQRGKMANSNAVNSTKQNILQAVEQAGTIEGAEDIVRKTLLDKFTAFVGEEIPEVPIAALGLDSLVSIELKNWVKNSLRTPLQISELNGAQSMLALAKLIVSRMNLKANKVNGTGPDDDRNRRESVTAETRTDSDLAAATTDATGVASNPGWHGQNCCKLHKKLPVQPLPDLDDTLNYWLEANEHLFSHQQLESIYQDIQAMRVPGSPARQILRDLYNTHGHDETNGWFADIVTDARFLCRRTPVAPWTSIMGAQRDNYGQRHSQVERAAIITSAALSYRRAMNAGEVEPVEIAGKPECTRGWGWLFHSARVPQLKCDKIVSYAPPPDDRYARDHIAVLRKGRVFKVMLQDEAGKDVSSRQLQATFEAIVARVEGDCVWTGLLTTDERDSWAQVGEHVTTFTLATSSN